MKIALCQTTVHKDWRKNLRNAERVIAEAVKAKADMVVLPEMFICPYNKKAILSAAQPEGGEAWQSMAEAAQKNHVYLAAGSIPESEDGHIYSTCAGFLTGKANRSVNTARCICSILMWRAVSITMNQVSLLPAMKYVLQRLNSVRSASRSVMMCVSLNSSV